jgi:glycosyltransferase involved in cell wall biosynthesis
MSDDATRLAVFNPGTHPAPKWIAAEAARQGRLFAYATGVGLAETEILAIQKVSARAANRLRQRMLPPEISRAALLRGGALQEVKSLRSIARSDWPAARRSLTARNQIILDKLGRLLDRSPEAAEVLLLPTGTRVDVHRRISLPIVLYTTLPIASHGEAVLRQEAEANPRWANFIGDIATDERSDFDAAELEKARVVLANSSYTAASFRAAGVPSESIRIEPLSVDRERVWISAGIAAPVTRKRASGEVLKLAFVGQIVQRKGLSYLFEALNRLPEGQVELTLVGTDPLGMTDALRAAYPAVRAHFTGPMPQGRVWKLLSDSHVMVFPSLLEGFGNVILEALAVGCPVITTARTGAPDLGIFGNSAVEVSPGDVESLHIAVVDLLANEDYRQWLSNNARSLDVFGGWSGYARRALKAAATALY